MKTKWLTSGFLSLLLFSGCSCQKNIDHNKINFLLYQNFEDRNIAEVKKMLELGANVNYHPQDALSMLDQAVIEGNLPLCELLLKHGANTENDAHKRNLLSYTTDKKIAQLLVQSGIHLDNIDIYGNLPIHWICCRRNTNQELLEYFLKKGSNVNAINIKGQTPLHIACFTSKNDEKFDYVKLLLEYGSNVNLRDNAGCTSFLYAAYHNNPRILKLLAPKTFINAQDNQGNSALHGAYILDGHKNIPLLLELGVSPQIRNKAGKLYNEK